MDLRMPVSPLLLLASLLAPGAQAGEAFGSLDQQIDNPTPIFAELFGRSLAEYQGNLMVGASGDILDTGQARRFGALYEYDAAGTLLRRISNPVPAEEALGFSIDVRGNDMLVGAATMSRA